MEASSPSHEASSSRPNTVAAASRLHGMGSLGRGGGTEGKEIMVSGGAETTKEREDGQWGRRLRTSIRAQLWVLSSI